MSLTKQQATEVIQVADEMVERALEGKLKVAAIISLDSDGCLRWRVRVGTVQAAEVLETVGALEAIKAEMLDKYREHGG